MVYITSGDGSVKKFACNTCIKGHRSTKCNHSERQLFEVRRKGRPVSQCAVCRELRVTKLVHVKCSCKQAHGSSKQSSPVEEIAPRPLDLQAHILSAPCVQCHRSRSFCTCADRSPPPVSQTSPRPPSLSTRPVIPIHDPTDDIDSDTPCYKSDEHVAPEHTAVLGALSHTSSEDLMDKIYGGFRNTSPAQPSTPIKSQCECSCHDGNNELCSPCALDMCEEYLLRQPSDGSS